MKNRDRFITEKILSIEEIDEDLTVDIGMDNEDHYFIANDILTHNTAWDNTEIKMENIAESAGLAHTVDVMYALIQDSMMHANKEYWLKVLKIRDGQGKGSRCRFNINYDYMRLTETDDITH